MTTAEEEMRKFHRTTFYQTVLYKKLEDVIIDKRYRITRACRHLGESWSRVRQYLSTEQKVDLNKLTKQYSKNGGRKLRYIKSSLKVS